VDTSAILNYFLFFARSLFPSSFLIDNFSFSCYIFLMTIEQTIEVPVDYRILLELPRSVPSGVKASVKINIPEVDKIDEVRLLLQKEMAQNGTATVPAVSGDGWEACVRERYAEP
jgi:hypothetical protein